MLPEFTRKTNIGVGIGIVAQVLGGPLTRSSKDAQLGWPLVILGTMFMIWGCSQYARAKGHSPWLGALGIFSIFGLIVLVLLPDRHKDGKA